MEGSLRPPVRHADSTSKEMDSNHTAFEPANLDVRKRRKSPVKRERDRYKQWWRRRAHRYDLSRFMPLPWREDWLSTDICHDYVLGDENLSVFSTMFCFSSTGLAYERPVACLSLNQAMAWRYIRQRMRWNPTKSRSIQSGWSMIREAGKALSILAGFPASSLLEISWENAFLPQRHRSSVTIYMFM